MKILNHQNILPDEKKVLKRWTSKLEAKFYRDIKKASENKYKNTSHILEENRIEWFNNLESLFENYEDNTLVFNEIYRADIIDNTFGVELSNEELFERFYSQFTINGYFEFPDIICSFSANKYYAINACEKNDKYNNSKTPRVLYILEKRVSKYLYIEEFSEVANEEEVLVILKSKFFVKNIIKKDNNFVEIYIDEYESSNPRENWEKNIKEVLEKNKDKKDKGVISELLNDSDLEDF
jgi:hypothetical protein